MPTLMIGEGEEKWNAATDRRTQPCRRRRPTNIESRVVGELKRWRRRQPRNEGIRRLRVVGVRMTTMATTIEIKAEIAVGGGAVKQIAATGNTNENGVRIVIKKIVMVRGV